MHRLRPLVLWPKPDLMLVPLMLVPLVLVPLGRGLVPLGRHVISKKHGRRDSGIEPHGLLLRRRLVQTGLVL